LQQTIYAAYSYSYQRRPFEDNAGGKVLTCSTQRAPILKPRRLPPHDVLNTSLRWPKPEGF